jgi:electron transfer flavoprotein alpha subunit
MTTIAVVPVRAGELALGGAETVAECGGRAVLIGDGVEHAALQLTGIATAPVATIEEATFAPARWARLLTPIVRADIVVVLPASADGRDLAPRLADLLDRPLLAGAMAITAHGADVVREGGLVIERAVCDGPFVATLSPGVRGVEARSGEGPPAIEPLPRDGLDQTPTRDAAVVEVLPADAATIDLAEATVILAGGAGLDGPERFRMLERVAATVNASVGGTRVVTDRGWLAHERQIGTTGVVVNPHVYVALGISGAVQHTSGLGHPDHVVAVNTDPYCPMMQLADIAIVADANAVLTALSQQLAADGTADSASAPVAAHG